MQNGDNVSQRGLHFRIEEMMSSFDIIIGHEREIGRFQICNQEQKHFQLLMIPPFQKPRSFAVNSEQREFGYQI